MGKETEFVRFPDADHNLSRTGTPNLRIARLDEITGLVCKISYKNKKRGEGIKPSPFACPPKRYIDLKSLSAH